ncbi:peptidoglycan-associated lipoprotein Pal [Leeia sp. TBRC 13508]|uniref:Peptidoglycan-associated lipoprotein n=1 Tax=Leeia speluncae TaxID=2884804 RepID=A0ABS8D6T7_9NEIS|nr:peptidoglycan-associated lipoprotein Pal [Leeia speluncae]MCB6183867.1 peptidoglycan-associated lipoprotein Pal [Leeia speluncae]
MRVMQFAGSILLAGLLAACASNNPQATNGAPVESRNNADANAQTTQVNDDGKMAQVDLDKQNAGDEVANLQKGSIFFDYDQYTVKDDFKGLIEANAAFLKNHPAAKVLIQGNTDDRGSREYNLALGQKRANAVKEALEVLGADTNRVEAASLGEEKPRCEQASEECYAQNRRADFLYQGQ